jgi:hypothetical protein
MLEQKKSAFTEARETREGAVISLFHIVGVFREEIFSSMQKIPVM